MGELCVAQQPQVAVVTRLTHQKGIHLIKHAAWRTLGRGGQFVLLGSAPDPRVQVSKGLFLCVLYSGFGWVGRFLFSLSCWCLRPTRACRCGRVLGCPAAFVGDNCALFWQATRLPPVLPDLEDDCDNLHDK